MCSRRSARILLDVVLTMTTPAPFPEDLNASLPSNVLAQAVSASDDRDSVPKAEDGVLAADSEQPAEQPRSCKVLVVEDEPVMRLVTEKILENAGYKVRQAADGLEAIELFRRDTTGYDAVVLDIVMPRLNGRETLALLRRMRPDLPVLVISGQPKDLALKGLREGRLLRFVGKPFLPKDLVEDFKRLLAEASEPSDE